MEPWMLIAGLVAVLVFFVVIFGSAAAENKLQNEIKLIKDGVVISKMKPMGKYISGHPDLDTSFVNALVIVSGADLIIYSGDLDSRDLTFRATIPVVAIKNVSIEDETSIRHKVTLGRILFIGIFAFAAKKKVTDELGYVGIDWYDGKFDHTTIFEFTGNGALQNANSCRNALIRMLSVKADADIVVR